jgi:SAM-dependent methyltransferase
MWDERYSRPGFAYGREPNAFLAEVAPRIPTGRVLSLGEGEGRNAVHLARLGHRVLAVDASSVGLAKARRLAAEHGVEIDTLEADLAEHVIEPGAWEGIVSIFCHLPPAVRRRVHRSAASGLAPGGAFVLEAYTPRQLAYGTGGPPRAELMMTLAELRDELPGLELEVARELEREIHEGRFHDGRGHVAQIVARRPPAPTRQPTRHERSTG